MVTRTSFISLFALTLMTSRIVLAALSVDPSLILMQIYKDAAHLFIGGLFVHARHTRCNWHWVLFWTLNATELICAGATRL